ncbi:hypothetical protein L1987_38589 [Smallanthus sonchifolius]|uniref:Uncharacterized protein n=1 Tax=Smallanthus sonchifolius TaxID=185202 RepID=A0ACB9HKJ1_9ASTR|nr:hypothetical protein L1987_38589 [Smallanthus sonchifolius]
MIKVSIVQTVELKEEMRMGVALKIEWRIGLVFKGCIDGRCFAIKKMKWNACEELKMLQNVSEYVDCLKLA